MVRRFTWFLYFIIATFALSEVLRASRSLTMGTEEGNIWTLLLWSAILILSFLVLGYDAYIKSKAEGKVVHQVWLYEKLYQLKHREKSQ